MMIFSRFDRNRLVTDRKTYTYKDRHRAIAYMHSSIYTAIARDASYHSIAYAMALCLKIC